MYKSINSIKSEKQPIRKRNFVIYALLGMHILKKVFP